MTVLFQDSDIAVVVKAQGELSQSDKSGEAGIPEKLSLQLGCQVYPVHRLDRPVGGIMVYALNKKSASSLSKQLQSDGIGFSKEYFALVSGIPNEKSAVFTDFIYKDGAKGKSFVCSSERKGVKRASLEYQTAWSNAEENISLVKIKLHTGRTHQIRVQFSSRGMPILGDGKYGSRKKYQSGIALYSCKLEFDHPSSGKRMVFEIPMPFEHFVGKIKTL